MKVLLLATGDVIAYRPGESSIATGAELLPPQFSHVSVEDVMAEPSWDTSTSTTLAIARRVRTALAEDGFDSVVVTHGLDTLEQTAFLIDLMAGWAGRVVLTGAFRHLDDPATDGPSNLRDALTAAHDARLRGTVVCLNSQLHAARWGTLSRAGVFSSDPHSPLGRVSANRVELTAELPDPLPEPSAEPESDVALIKVYPGMPPALLTTVTDAGARGVVLEGTGSGAVPVDLFTTIQELTDWNIPVVLAGPTSSRSLGVELGVKVGAIHARGLSPTHARIALMVALGEGDVRGWFDNWGIIHP